MKGNVKGNEDINIQTDELACNIKTNSKNRKDTNNFYFGKSRVKIREHIFIIIANKDETFAIILGFALQSMKNTDDVIKTIIIL